MCLKVLILTGILVPRKGRWKVEIPAPGIIECCLLELGPKKYVTQKAKAQMSGHLVIAVFDAEGLGSSRFIPGSLELMLGALEFEMSAQDKSDLLAGIFLFTEAMLPFLVEVISPCCQTVKLWSSRCCSYEALRLVLESGRECWNRRLCCRRKRQPCCSRLTQIEFQCPGISFSVCPRILWPYCPGFLVPLVVSLAAGSWSLEDWSLFASPAPRNLVP